MTNLKKKVISRSNSWHLIDEAFAILDSNDANKDVDKAISLIHESGAHTVMAELYIDGIHVKKDLKRARVILEFGAASGCGYSKLLLASFYEHGAGGFAKDHKKSFELILEASSSVFCGFQLARCFELGIGVDVDKEMSFNILSVMDDDALEKHGMYEDCIELARHHRDGIGTKVDPKAAKFYELLAWNIQAK